MIDELKKPNFFAKGLEYLGIGQEILSAFAGMTVDFDAKAGETFEYD